MSTLSRGGEQQEVRKLGQARGFFPESNGGAYALGVPA